MFGIYVLSKLKRTASYWTRHDTISGATNASISTQIWNLSLSTHSWPNSCNFCKKANINSLPKVIFPVEDSEIQFVALTLPQLLQEPNSSYSASIAMATYCIQSRRHFGRKCYALVISRDHS